MNFTTRPLAGLIATAVLGVVALSPSGCSFMTDAATRLAADVSREAKILRDSPDRERTFEHVPASSPEGCAGAYTVKFQESLHHPQSGGAILVGCQGEEGFARQGYSYSTTSHLHAVRVPAELIVEKAAGDAVRITLRKNGGTIDVVRLE